MTNRSRAHPGAACNYPFLTQKERDVETGLDYFGARYYASTQGRFTGVDPISMSIARLYDPQRISLYVYCRNNPLKYLDPDGADLVLANRAAKARVRQVIDPGLTTSERQNITVRGNRVVIVDRSKIDSATASPAYRGLSEIIGNQALTIKYFAVGKGQNVTVSDGTRISYTDAYKANGLTTGSAGYSVRDVIIPIGGGPLVKGSIAGTTVTTPESAEFAHEAYGHGLNKDAIAVENEFRLSLTPPLPTRSGKDHESFVDVTSSPELLQTDTSLPATQIQSRPTVPLIPEPPPKRPN